jgi:tetratricopeptide (TPR) repeat protein
MGHWVHQKRIPRHTEHVTVHNEAGGRLSGSIVQAGSIHHVSLTNSPTTPVVPHQLPLAIRDFVGRTEHLAALDALLPTDEAGTVVISALDGTGGVGKTTLAIHWAHSVQDRFPDGTLYINLRGYGTGEPATPAEVLNSFLRALDCPPEAIPIDLEAQSGLYRSLLAGRRVLIVLDNASTADQVRPLLPGTAGCLVLITSRASLTGLVISESAIRVTIDLLTPPEAIHLVRGIIGGDRADSEPEAVDHLTRLCARLPLALRIAAHRAAARPHSLISDIVSELSDSQTRLDQLTVPGDELATVRSVLSWSDRTLPADQSRMFRMLGLHPGSHISADAAAALADVSPLEGRRLLDSLVDVHLLSHLSNDRYAFHDLLRAYASEQVHQLETSNDRNDAIHRLLNWYLYAHDTVSRHLWHSVRVRLTGSHPPRYPLAVTTPSQARQWLQIELPNLLTAAQYAAGANIDAIAWQLPCMGFGQLVPLDDMISLYLEGLAATRRLGDQYGESYTLLSLGDVYELRHQFSESTDVFQIALAISSRIGDRLLMSWALCGIGNGLREQGHPAQAIEFHQKAIAIWQEDENQWALGVGYLNLAHNYLQLRRFDEATQYYTQAEDIFVATGDQFRLAGAWRNRGKLEVEMERYPQAIALYSRSLTIIQEVDHRYYEVSTLIELGTAWQRLGKQHQTRLCWEQAMVICEKIRDHRANEIRTRLNSLEPDLWSENLQSPTLGSG